MILSIAGGATAISPSNSECGVKFSALRASLGHRTNFQEYQNAFLASKHGYFVGSVVWHTCCDQLGRKGGIQLPPNLESLSLELKMTTDRIKLIAIVFFAVPLLLLAMFKVTPVQVAASMADDPAATYKAKCAACHTPTASKFFDPTHTEETQVQVILKGKKGEKPPYMPAFGEKGITEDDAKALAAYMRTLKPAS